MAKVTVTKGLVVALLFIVLISLITPTHANWYGKRGMYLLHFYNLIYCYF